MAIGMRILGMALGVVVLLAPTAPAADEEAVKKAIEGGVAYLKRVQQSGGDWRHSQHALGVTALATLTLLECEVDKDDPAIQKAAAFVRLNSLNLNHTYSISLTILLLDRLGEEKDQPILESLTNRLVKGQNAMGGWSYYCAFDPEEVRRLKSKLNDSRDSDKKSGDEEKPDAAGRLPANVPPKAQRQFDKLPRQLAPGVGLPAGDFNQAGEPGFGSPNQSGDNSNTQFATLALWVARKHSLSLPIDDALSRVDSRFRLSQNADGGWSYIPVAGGAAAGSTPAMTCAGLLGLAVGYGVGNETAVRTDLKASSGRRRERAKERRDPNRDPNVRAGLMLLGGMIKGPFASARRLAGWGGVGNPVLPPNVAAGLQQGGPARVGNQTDYYSLWSIERVAMALGLKTLNKLDWYSWGADLILVSQKPDGHWEDGGYTGSGALTDTCFALLFLGRSNLASDLTAKLKGKLRDPGEVKLTSGGVGGESLKHRESERDSNRKETPKSGDKPKTGSLPRLVDPGEKTDARETSPRQPKSRSGDDNQGGEVARLSSEVARSLPEQQAALLDKLRDSKGPVYTQALAEAIPQLSGTIKTKAREALAERLSRMTATTLRDKFGDEDLEIRRAAALASAVKADKSFVPDLIKLLEDEEPLVARAAHAALKALTGKDLGPEDDSSGADRQKAIADWRAWWNRQAGASAQVPRRDDDPAPDDKQRLQGTWVAERLEGENRETSKKLLEKTGIQLVIRGDKFTLYVQKRPTSKGTFALEPAKKPREIDLISGTNVAKGIYDWEDDHLKLCINPVNKARPTEFVSNPQVNRYSYILKRQKP